MMARLLSAICALASAISFADAATPHAGCAGSAAICDGSGAGRFALIERGAPAAIYADTEEYAGVKRAARNLRTDLAAIGGARGLLWVGQAPRAGARVIIVGSLEKSPTVARLAREGKIDVSKIKGRWEAFLQQVVEDPLPGVSRALVIAGSDKRGAIYGVYDLSERAGVSPWAWWADAPVRRAKNLYIASGQRTDAPAIRYRGIFLNDENPALLGWADKTFGGFNHKFYERVFELILRLKGNFLWPAMWGKAFYDDDPLNGALADEMGVVIGTSHHEPMARAQEEWARYGHGPWDYEKNAKALRAFWRKGIERMDGRETLVTIGMRGDGDKPMTEHTAIGLLERIVSDQRQIIADVTGRNASETPQVWALYKEVQDYYDKGMRVPDDVTLLFSDDNWGNIRRLPSPGASRKGGYGVYYHFDYVGAPRNYKWINTNQIERVWEQMSLAYAYGARRLWIVNVGDLKPMELPMSFFLDYAWNPSAWPLERLPDYTRRWAARQIDETHAEEIAKLLDLYTKYNARRKPELLSADTYSLVHYRESERVASEWRALADRAEALRRKLPKDELDAYLQLVWFPIEASANLNELYRAVALNRLYARQRRVATNAMATKAEEYFEKDAALTRFYHRKIAGGKWDQMMSQTHIGYTSWQQPDKNIMPTVERYEAPRGSALGVAIEGDARFWPGGGGEALLPAMDSHARRSRTIEIFNHGRRAFRYRIRTDAPWLRISAPEGRVRDQIAVTVSVDWDAAPAGSHRARMVIEGPNGETAEVIAPIFKPEASVRRGFLESNGVVAMEAAHCARAIGADGVQWKEIPNLGRTGSGVAAFPETAKSQNPGAGARLEYDFTTFGAGASTVEIDAAPSLDFRGRGGLRYAVSMDDGTPVVVNMNEDASEAAWENDVARNANIRRAMFTIATAGRHTLKLWRVDPGVVFERVVAFRGDLPESYLGPPESDRVSAAPCEGLSAP
ncbi:MAG: glycosyl hydrolase [Alphaproteobacteria bacterium]|nr:glycosyl hydrolase [Alphaproteobacteria bacterium]